MGIRSTSPTWSPTSSSGPTARATSISTSSCGTRPAASVPGSGTPSEELARSFEPGDYLRVRGKTQVFQGSLQVILTHIDVLDPNRVEAEDFLPQSSQNVAKLMARLREVLLAMNNPHLRALVECFLIDDEFVRKFTTAPAGIKNHHAYQGGLLEHVVTLLNVADRILDLYPEIDRDLLLTGIFLHDIGKVDELSYDRAFAYTDEGQLVGHLVMGVEMLRDKVERTEKLTGEPFPPELLLRLKHMIVSHHGTYEFGSPKLPMTLEAIALHYLDNLDAKIHAFSREIRDDPSRDSNWTPFQQSLGAGSTRERPAQRPTDPTRSTSETRTVVVEVPRGSNRSIHVSREETMRGPRLTISGMLVVVGLLALGMAALFSAVAVLDLAGGRDYARYLALHGAGCPLPERGGTGLLPWLRSVCGGVPGAGRMGLDRRPARPRPLPRAR